MSLRISRRSVRLAQLKWSRQRYSWNNNRYTRGERWHSYSSALSIHNRDSEDNHDRIPLSPASESPSSCKHSYASSLSSSISSLNRHRHSHSRPFHTTAPLLFSHFHTLNHSHHCPHHSQRWMASSNTQSDSSSSSPSSTPPSSPRRRPNRVATLSQSSSLMRYLNPIYVGKKIVTLLWRIMYVTLDSIIHPSRGKDRLKYAWTHTAAEFKLYKDGAILLWNDIKHCIRIMRKLLRGGELTFRERRQLRRTVLDILRMVPFAFFVFIPFLEFLLPVALILFPNMLPSTFQSDLRKQENRRKQVQLRLDLAKFLEETLSQFAEDIKKRDETVGDSANRLEDIINKVRNGQSIDNSSILKISQLFDDHITLDNASSSELANMCRYMGLNSFGTPALLRIRLHTRIRQLRREDREIRKEGVNKIDDIKMLRALVRDRGMRADHDRVTLKSHLSKWLELSLDHHVPTSLLIMSRIFTLEHASGEEPTNLIHRTLNVVGDETINEVLVEKAGVTDAAIEKEVLDRQAKLIKEEEKQKTKKKPAAAEPVAAPVTPVAETAPSPKPSVPLEVAPVSPATAVDGPPLDELTEENRKKRLLQLATALQILAAKTPLEREKQELESIKERLSALLIDTDLSSPLLMEQLSSIRQPITVAPTATTVEPTPAAGDAPTPPPPETITFDGEPFIEVAPKPVTRRFEVDSEVEMPTPPPSAVSEAITDAGESVTTEEMPSAPAEEESEEELEARAMAAERARVKSEKTRKKLSKRVHKMITGLESSIDQTGVAIGDAMRAFEDEDNISYDDVRSTIEKQLKQMNFSDGEIEDSIAALDLKGDGKISLAELNETIEMISRDFNYESSESDSDSDDESELNSK